MSVVMRTRLRAKSRLHAVRADGFCGGGGIGLLLLFIWIKPSPSRRGRRSFLTSSNAECHHMKRVIVNVAVTW